MSLMLERTDSGGLQDPTDALSDYAKEPWKAPDPLGLFSDGSNSAAAARRRQLEARQAAITRDQWQNFIDVYRPVEQDLLERAMQTDFSKEGDEAGQDAAVAAQSSKGMLARNLSRMGSKMTPEQAEAVRRRAQLGETKSVAKAENTTRRTLYDTRGNLLAGLVQVGRGVATGAMGGLNSAANNAARTEMMLNQGAAAAQNQNMSMAASGLAFFLAAI